MPKREQFEYSRFILTEGFEDAALLRALITFRKMNDFDVSPTTDLGSKSGKSGFENAVMACEPQTKFSEVKDVVIVADNDGNPAASFKEVCNQIEKARLAGDLKRDWGTPIDPAVKSEGNPSVSIWMWPSPDQPGCMETVLWEVIKDKYSKEAECAETACNCTEANLWTVSKLDKARVRCFMSIAYKRNPGLALHNLWRRTENFIPLNHKAFTPISRFLANI